MKEDAADPKTDGGKYYKETKVQLIVNSPG